MSKTNDEGLLNVALGELVGDKTYPRLSYDGLVKSLGCEIVVEADTADYLGDRFMLVRDGERWGFLSIQFGTCAQCDALEACETADDVKAERDRLADGIDWYGSRADALLSIAGKVDGVAERGGVFNSIEHTETELQFYRKAAIALGATDQ